MTELYAFIACFILMLLALFQLALVLGAPIGRFAWGGNHKILPTKLKISSLVAILLYVPFAVVLLDKAKITNFIPGDATVNVSIWLITAYLFVGIIMNAISKSKHERAVMTPIALVLALLFLAVALSQ